MIAFLLRLGAIGLNTGLADEQLHIEIINTYPDLTQTNEVYVSSKPLYYWLYHGQSITGLRLMSALLGTACVFIGFLIVREFSSEKIALLSAAFIAFLPSHILLSAVVNSDNLSIFFAFLFAWFYVWGVKEKNIFCWVTAELFMLLAFFAKTSTYFLAMPFIIGTAYLAYHDRRWRWFYSALPLFFVAAFWLLKNGLHLASANKFSYVLIAQPTLYFSSLLMGYFFLANEFIVYHWWVLIPFSLFFMFFGFAVIGLFKHHFTILEHLAIMFFAFNFLEIFISQLLSVDWQGRYLFPSMWAVAYFFWKGLEEWKKAWHSK